MIKTTNDYQGVEISLSKVMENDELFGIYGEDCYTNVLFGLFSAEDITAADGTVIPVDGLISEISLDENYCESKSAGIGRRDKCVLPHRRCDTKTK